MQDDVIGCDETPVMLMTPAILPLLSKDASVRDRRRHEVLAEAIAKERPSLTARMWAYRGVNLPVNVLDFTAITDSHRHVRRGWNVGPAARLRSPEPENVLAPLAGGDVDVPSDLLPRLRQTAGLVRRACWNLCFSGNLHG